MVTLLMVLSGLALAQDDAEEESDLNLAGQIHMSINHRRVEDPAAMSDMRSVTTAEISVWQAGFDGDRTSGQFNMEIGGGGGGFAWGTELLLGPGGWATKRFGMSLETGLALGGVTRNMPVAFHVPVEASIVVQPLNRMRLRPWARVDWVAGANHPRKAGGTTLPFLDEFRWGVDAYLGEMLPVDQDGDLGWHLGFSWEEVMGTRLLGVQLGKSLGERPEKVETDLFGMDAEQWEALQALMAAEGTDNIFGDGTNGGDVAPEGSETGELGDPLEGPDTSADGGAAAPVGGDYCAAWTDVVTGFEGDFASATTGPHPDDGAKQLTSLSLPRAAGAAYTTQIDGGAAWVQPLWTGTSEEAGVAFWTSVADGLTGCALPGTWVAERSDEGPVRSAWWLPFNAGGTPWEGKRLEILLEPIPSSSSWRVMARARAQ